MRYILKMCRFTRIADYHFATLFCYIVFCCIDTVTGFVTAESVLLYRQLLMGMCHKTIVCERYFLYQQC